jgi:tRNA-modifying protein YgfZ
MFDSLFLKQSESIYMLDVSSDLKSKCLNHLARHKLRNPITIDDAEESLKVMVDANDGYIDPRSTELPKRSIYDSSKTSIDLTDAYNLQRIIAGVPEGMEIIDSFPLQMNIDLMNGISFSKGCYVGQELTTRTMRRGVVRRRIVTLEFKSSLDKVLDSFADITINDQKIGKVVAFAGNRAIALVQGINGEALNDAAVGAKILSDLSEVRIGGIDAVIRIPKYFSKH